MDLEVTSSDQSTHILFLDIVIVTLEDGTDVLSLIVGNKLPTGTVQHPRSQESMTETFATV
jgi:hypothetical protein